MQLKTKSSTPKNNNNNKNQITIITFQQNPEDNQSILIETLSFSDYYNSNYYNS